MERKIKAQKSLQKTFTTTIFLLHLIVLAFSLSFNSIVLFRISEKQALREGQNSLQYTSQQMDNLVANLLDIRTFISQDKYITQYLRQNRTYNPEDIILRIDARDSLNTLVKSYNYIDSITLFQWGTVPLGVSKTQFSQGSTLDEPLTIQHSKQFQTLNISSPPTWGGIYNKDEMIPNCTTYKKTKEEVVAMLLPLYDIWYDNPISILSINIPVNYFDFMYSKNTKLGSNVYLFDKYGELLFQVSDSSKMLVPDYGNYIANQANMLGNFNTSCNGVLSKVIYYHNAASGWYLAEEIPYPVFLSNMFELQKNSGLVFLIAAIISVVFSHLISKKLLNPFDRIVEHMLNIENGDLTQRLPALKYRELNFLCSHFNNMMNRIEQLVITNQRIEEQKRTLEIEALQSQINPHFLYNSLTTIRWMASMARASNVCQALLSLNNVLQPIFSNQGIVWELENEKKFLENFIDIMGFRFGTKIKCSYEIPTDLLHLPILRFILQPIVENAICHGLRGVPGGEIQISAKYQERLLIISVSDNGCGILPEKLDNINKALSEDSRNMLQKEHHGYGLYNVNHRIRLHYGKSYGIFLQSIPNEYTTTYIHLPANIK